MKDPLRTVAPVFVIVSLAWVGGCGLPPGGGPSAIEPGGTPAIVRVWPAPPAPARIRYARTIARPAELGIRKSVYARLVDSLTGAREDRFMRPTGVAERNGVVYVADPDAQALWILDSGRARYRKVESVGDVSLVSPVAVAVRPDGAVFVADTGLKKVFLVDRDGKPLPGGAAEGLERPAGVAFDPATRRLYVADSALQAIFVYEGDGTLRARWGRAGSGDGEFNRPTHVCVESDGTVLVTDALNFRIQAFDTQGKPLWKFGHHGDGSGDLASPKGVAADAQGHVLVVDALFDTVQIFGRDGTFLLSFGEKGAGAGELSLPGGLFVSRSGHIYVADGYNRRIQVFAFEAGGSAQP